MKKNEYLERIYYKGKLQPTLAVLQNLQKSHLLNIPFENLDIHYGIPIALEIDQIYKKIVVNGRGGFCYELNGLFFELLKSIGFSVKLISARVFDGSNYGQEFDHMAIIVKIDEQEYLADVGFGEFSFAPLKFVLEEMQNDQNGNFRIDKYNETYFRVNKIVNEKCIPEYIFENEERTLSEYGGMCHYHQTNPKSHFTQKRLISKPTENGRVTISGNMLKIKEDGAVRKIFLRNEAAFEEALWEHFRVKVKE